MRLAIIAEERYAIVVQKAAREALKQEGLSYARTAGAISIEDTLSRL